MSVRENTHTGRAKRMISREAHDTAAVIHGAIDSGALRSIRVVETRSNGSVEAWAEWDAYQGSQFLDKCTADLLQFQRMFPGGKLQGMGLQTKNRKRGPAIDRARYINNRGPVMVIFNYYVAHECRDFVGRAETGGTPKWWCASCKKPVTTTQARAMNLLPKLVRKGTK